MTASPSPAASAPASSPPAPAPLTPAEIAENERMHTRAIQDRARMMARLGLQEPTLPTLTDDPKRPPHTKPSSDDPRRWTDGDPSRAYVRSAWGNWVQYDLHRAKVGALPDPLTLNNGWRVTDATTWWQVRRPELVELFAREIYGRIPTSTPAVTWEIGPESTTLEGTALERRIVGHIDNTAFPAATPAIEFTLTLPRSTPQPVPVMVSLAFIIGGRDLGDDTGYHAVLQRGWGFVKFNPMTVQADTGGALDRGIIGLVSRGRPREPDEWGVIAAWSWALSRILDQLVTDPRIDAHRIGVAGLSRFGKTALVAAAHDPRWAVVYSSCSGAGGAKLHRHDFGESLDIVCSTTEYHWMAGNFLKYAGNWTALPIDQHELITLIAPRPVFVTGGTQDPWADPVGEFLACVHAGPVYRLLGQRDLGTSEMPAPNQPLVQGTIGFVEHAGGHTDAPDWPVFLDFAARHFGQPSASP